MSNVSMAGVTHDIDGVTYEFQPLTLEDLEWLELWLRSKAIEAGRMSIPPGRTQQEQDALMRPVLDAANRINITTSFDQMLTPAGVARMLFRMVQKKHPSITLDTVGSWVADPELMLALMPKVQTLVPGKKGDLKVIPMPDKNPQSRFAGKKSRRA